MYIYVCIYIYIRGQKSGLHVGSSGSRLPRSFTGRSKASFLGGVCLDPRCVVLFLDLLWILVRFMVRNPQKAIVQNPQKELQMGVQVGAPELVLNVLYGIRKGLLMDFMVSKTGILWASWYLKGNLMGFLVSKTGILWASWYLKGNLMGVMVSKREIHGRYGI